jgi:hypothetical protein
MNRSITYTTSKEMEDETAPTRTGLVFNRPRGTTVDSMDATGNLQLKSLTVSHSQESSQVMDTSQTKENKAFEGWEEPSTRSQHSVNNV